MLFLCRPSGNMIPWEAMPQDMKSYHDYICYLCAATESSSEKRQTRMVLAPTRAAEEAALLKSNMSLAKIIFT